MSHVQLNKICWIIYWQTHHSLSRGCLVVQLKLDQLDKDVVDLRPLLVSIHGEKCCYLFMMDEVAVVPHAQTRKRFYDHAHTDRRDIGVAALRTTIPVRVQTQFILQYTCWAFNFVHSLLSLCERRSSTTKAWGVNYGPGSLSAVEDNNTPILHDSFGQRPEDIATFGNGHLATRCFFSSSDFWNFIYKNFNSIHVSLRRDILDVSLFRER